MGRWRPTSENLSAAKWVAEENNAVILLQIIYRAKPFKDLLATLDREILIHPLHSPDLNSFNYYLFSSIKYALTNQHFKITRRSKIGLINGLILMNKDFFGIRIDGRNM